MESIPYSKIFKLDWRWVGLGFCFFVSFHLLPSYIIYLTRIISPGMTVVYSSWIFGGLAIVGFLIGYLSRGVTIWEATVSSAVYAILLLSAVNNEWNGELHLRTSYWIIAIIAIATLSAWFGEYVQAMKEKKVAQKDAADIAR
jgi:hypothetical protein